VLSFFLVELDTTGAIDGSDRLLLRGRFPPKVIESGLRKYIGTAATPADPCSRTLLSLCAVFCAHVSFACPGDTMLLVCLLGALQLRR
jgi:hypothetical protein